MVQNASLGINVDKAVFRNNLAKLKQGTRTVRSRTLSMEEIDFYLLMLLALSSLLVTVVKRCMNLTCNDKRQVKKIYTESHDIRTKYISGVNSIMNTLPIPKVISYNQLSCKDLNETINHMLGNGCELKSLDINCDTDGNILM